LSDFVRMLRGDGHAIEHVDLGGGLGIPYRDDNDPPPDPAAYAQVVKRATRSLDCLLIFEPGRLLVGNAGVLGPLSPLDHVEPKYFGDAMDVNVRANWQLIRTMDALLNRAAAGRAVFVTSSVAYKGRAYWGPYAASKAALDALVRTYAAECANSNVRANLFSPGPTRTRMYIGAFPGVDPATLPTPEDVAKAMIPLCLPECSESGKIYSFREKRFLEFKEPG